MMISNNLLNDTPEDIALFLYKGERLTKTKVSLLILAPDWSSEVAVILAFNWL